MLIIGLDRHPFRHLSSKSAALTVVILSTISREEERRPLRSFGSIGSRNSGASVGSVVKEQIVIESVASKASSPTMTTGRGLPA
jgi:hypothetical protein